MTQCRTENALFLSEHVIQNPRAVCVFMSPVLISSSTRQSSGGYSFASKAIAVAFARWNFLLRAAKKKQRGKIYCVFEAK